MEIIEKMTRKSQGHNNDNFNEYDIGKYGGSLPHY